MFIESVITSIKMHYLFGVVVRALNTNAMIKSSNPDVHQ
jgi:hypothetical protein